MTWHPFCVAVRVACMKKIHKTGKRVLLVEDDRGFREMLGAILRTESYSVIEANNGAEALGLFREGPFDLVMLDLGLPFLKGDELAVRIRQMVPRQPILMLTGYAATPGVQCPVDALLRKPVDFPQLRGVMADLLAESETRVAV